MTLTAVILSALRQGQFQFESNLPNPRFCHIGDLRLVRPVVGNRRWHLVVGSAHEHVKIGLAAHLALEWCRIGWQRANLTAQKGET